MPGTTCEAPAASGTLTGHAAASDGYSQGLLSRADFPIHAAASDGYSQGLLSRADLAIPSLDYNPHKTVRNEISSDTLGFPCQLGPLLLR
jgi:hypothetical protein